MKLELDFFYEIEKASLFKLTKDEKSKIIQELEGMLQKFEVLDKFDDKNIEPFDFNLDFFNNFREDLTIKSNDNDFSLKNQDFFKVPKTLN